MSRWQGKIAVVTGASSGIGLAIARALVKEGMIVLGLARRKEQMEEIMNDIEGNGKFYPRKCDISDEAQVIEAFQWIKQNFGVVQIMVNNAGLTKPGTLHETSRRDWEAIFNVNVMGLLECTKQAVLMMKESNVEGYIININSIQGHRVYSFGSLRSNVYAASKHAVTAITETLRNELLGTKIRVTSISPGLVKTEILANSGIDIAALDLPALDPEDIAESVLYAIRTPLRVQITELTIRPMGEHRS